MNNEKNTCQVFISHKTGKNGDFLELLCSKLKEANICIWIAPTSIDAGEEWRVAIDIGILNSDVILVILDAEACASPYVTYEWAFALGSGKTIIPILTEDCKIHERITVLHYMDFRNGNRPWGQLIERISAIQLKRKEIPKIGDLTVSEFEEMFKASKTILWVNYGFINYKFEELNRYGLSFNLAISTSAALSLLVNNNYCAIVSCIESFERLSECYVLLEKIRKLDTLIPYFIYTVASTDMEKGRIEAQERGVQGMANSPDELMTMVISHVQPK